MDVNRYNLPFEYRFGELVIADEIREQIIAGNVSYEWCISVVECIVSVVDKSILRIGYGQ